MRLIFGADGDFELARSARGVRPVVWDGERYLASYLVAVK